MFGALAPVANEDLYRFPAALVRAVFPAKNVKMPGKVKCSWSLATPSIGVCGFRRFSRSGTIIARSPHLTFLRATVLRPGRSLPDTIADWKRFR
jgi:hypothetical protein